MKKKFTVSEAAKIVNMTGETLRHYDRIGLVSPSERDPWTGYRFYSEQELVRLQTIQALRCMDLSLKAIKEVLEYDDLEKIIAFLKRAERSAEDKIAQLQYAKEKIGLARADYEKKRRGPLQTDELFTQLLPQRAILLSETLCRPTLDNLWQYHTHFYDQIEESRRSAFAFEDLAGIYTSGGRSRLFAVCLRYPDTDGLTLLPAGTYLCANCSEESREKLRERMLQHAQRHYGIRPEFLVELIVISGILQWKYQIQMFLKS